MSKARDIADLDFNSPDIDGGNIDGATIGGTTPAAGSFTGMKVNGSFTVNGNVDTSSNLGEVLQLSQTDSIGGFLWSVDRANNTYKHMTYHASRHKFYSDASTEMMSITSSGIDVTGAGTFNGLISGPSLQVTGNAIASLGSAFEAFVASDVIYTGALDRASGDYRVIKNSANRYEWLTGTTTGSTTEVRLALNLNGAISTTPEAGGHAIFNEGGVDADFRVESDSNQYMLFVDGGNNRVGIGTSSPSAVLTTETTGALTLDSNDGDHSAFGLLVYLPTSRANTVSGAIGFSGSGGRKYAAIGAQTYADTDQAGLNFYVQPSASGSTAAMVEAMRIDQASNLLVGTSSNDGQSIGTGSEDGVVLTGESQYIQRGDNANLWLSKPSGATNSEYIKFYNNSASVGNIGTASGDLNINGPAGHSGIRFQASSILPRYDGADTDGTMDIGYNDGTATHRWRDLYLSGGVYLGGTGAAHKLDDYEEVNFTATLRGSTEPSTLLTVTAFATKIGRVVQYSIGFENINTTGYSGYVTITGLPFTNNGGRAMGNLVAYQGLTYSGTDPFSVIGVNSTTLEAFSISSNSTWAQSHHDPGNGSYFWLTGTYMTTA